MTKREREREKRRSRNEGGERDFYENKNATFFNFFPICSDKKTEQKESSCGRKTNDIYTLVLVFAVFGFETDITFSVL